MAKGNLYNLEFVHSLSTVVMEMKMGNKKYEITTSVHQCMILFVLENEDEPMTSEELGERLEIPVEMVIRSIHSLVILLLIQVLWKIQDCQKIY